MFKGYTRRKHNSGSHQANLTIQDYARNLPALKAPSRQRFGLDINKGFLIWARKQGITIRTIRKPLSGFSFSGLYKAIDFKTGNVGYGETTKLAFKALMAGIEEGQRLNHALIRMAVEKGPFEARWK